MSITKQTTLLICFFFAISFFLIGSENNEEPHSLNVSLDINLISRKSFNGRGKENDFIILKDELEKLGHRIHIYDLEDKVNISNADINIFLAHFNLSYFSKAKLNWFIPNAETCTTKVEQISKFDLILCKTKESIKIFKPISKKIKYLGFTSIDRYEASISKDYLQCLHIVGGSGVKGFYEVVRAWNYMKGLPNLTVIKHNIVRIDKEKLPNQISLIDHWIPLDELISLQNTCGTHLCPSKTEGFGHSIMEGMSAEAVIITTNAPPMNEFIKDKRCLVKYSKKGKRQLATTYEADYRALAKTVKEIQQLSTEELERIGQGNRAEYLKRDAEFKRKLKRLMNSVVEDLEK
ncbi:MAG: glycosyltransferase [Chlamydiales bacterium]